jgi:2'-5' RNA ligase
VSVGRDLLRIFLAVFPPAAVQRAAHAVGERLRAAGDGVSWVKADNLHYTMRFIGDVGEDGARRVGEAATAAAAKHRAFDATLGGVGAFPNAKRARVIWLGLARGGPELEALARGLETELRARGFDRADKRFTAHLTLGRVRDFGADWTGRLDAVPALDPAPGFRVDRLLVVRSQLNPKGSIYTVETESHLS